MARKLAGAKMAVAGMAVAGNPVSGSVLDDEVLDGLHLARHDVHVLLELFDAHKLGRAWRGLPKGLVDRLGKLDGQGGFQHQHGNSGLDVFARHLDAVGSVRIDEHAITLVDIPDGGKPISVTTGAGGKTIAFKGGTQVGEIELAVALELLP